MKFADYPDSERTVAVSTFDARFGEMERALWCLSVNSRAGLLAGESSPVLEALVWTIKSWWGGNPGWIGSLEPRSPLRALDKLAWWLGGGSTGAVAEVHDPWKVPQLLGLHCP